MTPNHVCAHRLQINTCAGRSLQLLRREGEFLGPLPSRDWPSRERMMDNSLLRAKFQQAHSHKNSPRKTCCAPKVRTFGAIFFAHARSSAERCTSTSWCSIIYLIGRAYAAPRHFEHKAALKRRGSMDLLAAIMKIAAHMVGLQERMKGPRYDVFGPRPVCADNIADMYA